MAGEFKGDKKEIHHKIVGFSFVDAKEIKTKDGDFGVIKGYASTYNNVDRGGDIIKKGAFINSIKRHLDEDRQVRMFFQHDRMFPIGGYPAEKIVDDEKGLLVEGNINLKADKGRSTYELIKQGAISDLSIGYSINDAIVDDDGNLNLIDLELWEISPVSEPMNTQANILSVKSDDQMKSIEELSSIKDVENYLKTNFSLYSKERKTLISKIKSFTRDVKKDEDNKRDAESTKEIEENETNLVEKLKSIELQQKLNSINSLFKGDNHAR